MTECADRGCDREAIMAVATRAPKDKSLVTTIYQDEADAPKNAPRYCGQHGVSLAASLAALTDADLHPRVTFDG